MPTPAKSWARSRTSSPPPASNVYVVKGGKQSHMIPAVPEFVIETNVDGGYIRVRLIEGM